MLALGEFLVKELKLRERGDWLERWLAHHLAELIARVDANGGAGELAEATDIILRLWAGRANLPGTVNPLGRYREALEALLALREGQVPRVSFRSKPSSLVALCDRIPRLLQALLALSAVTQGGDEQTPRAVADCLAEEERKLLASLEVWIFNSDASGQGVLGPPAKTPVEELRGVVYRLIDETIAELQEMRGGRTHQDIRGEQTLRRAPVPSRTLDAPDGA